MMNLGIPGGQILMIVSDGGINAGDRKILLGLFDGSAGSNAGFIGGSYGDGYIIDFDAGGW